MPNNTYIDENIILSYFETGDFPTQAQFAASWTSYWHKSATIPQSSIENLSLTLQGFADKTLFETHLQDADAHSNSLLKLDASNITDVYRQQLRDALGVGDIPDNVALVDAGESQDVFNKNQINELCLLIADFVTGGKIRADKIEALGLTEIHEVTETTLVSFAANSANYEFEKNDIIAIPDGAGNFALYIFKGGVKTTTANYLPTGLTNITIGMVEGLQAALDGKMNKPTVAGGFFARKDGANTSWVQISPASFYLLLWDGSDFQTSNIYQTGNKLGILTQTPSEALHVNGRVRAKAFVFDNNTEILPNQITLDGSHFWGTAANGVRRQLMFGDFTDYRALWQSMTDAEKTIIKTEANGGWTTNTMSVAVITPPIAAKKDIAQWFIMRGANLNLNPSTFAVYLVDVNNVEYQVPNSQVQLYANGLDLAFWYNFKNLALGKYKIRLWNGIASYTTGASVEITLVQDVTPIDFSGITWEKKSTTQSEVDNTITASGTTVIHKPNIDNAPYSEGITIIAGAKSSKILESDENFYIKASSSIGMSYMQYWGSILGVSGINTPLELVNSSLAYSVTRGRRNGNSLVSGYADNSPEILESGQNIFQFQVVNFETIIIRNQGIYTIIISSGSGSRVFVKSGSNDALSLVYYGLMASNSVDNGYLCSASTTILEGYKFN